MLNLFRFLTHAFQDPPLCSSDNRKDRDGSFTMGYIYNSLFCVNVYKLCHQDACEMGELGTQVSDDSQFLLMLELAPPPPPSLRSYNSFTFVHFQRKVMPLYKKNTKKIYYVAILAVSNDCRKLLFTV